MKYLIFTIILIISLTSCKKQELEPYYNGEPEECPYPCEQEEPPYVDGGVLPDTTDLGTSIIGQTWIIPQYKPDGFSTVTLSPPDTLIFNPSGGITWILPDTSVQVQYNLIPMSYSYKLEFLNSPRFGYCGANIAGNFLTVGAFFLVEFKNDGYIPNYGNFRITMERI